MIRPTHALPGIALICVTLCWHAANPVVAGDLPPGATSLTDAPTFGPAVGGAYETVGSTAQPGAVGVGTSATYELSLGFWFRVASIETIASPSPAGPPHDILKNRYVSIDPRGADEINVGKDLDIRVTLTSTLVNGVTTVGAQWWANAPDANCIAVVGPTRPAVPPNWDACATLHLAGCPIIPTSTYEIVVVEGMTVSDPPLVVATQAKPGVKWHGDCVGFFDGAVWTPPNGVTSIDDAVAAIKTFQNINAFNATHVSVTDMVPNLNGLQINKIVNINDVFSIILGFQGLEYPGPLIELCPDP